MVEFIPRPHYLEILREFRDKPFIKVITGMRRCGKTTLMMMFRQEIIESGIPENDVLYINLGNELECTISTYRELIDHVKSTLGTDGRKYLFLDEIQNVQEWERAIETFHISGLDIYLTGSNSRMLSSEISTKLSGRFVCMDVLPLSFSEFLVFRERYGNEGTLEDKFSEYLHYGGLPATALMSGMRDDLISMTISSTYDTVIVKDVMERNNVRNPAVISNLFRFLMKNIGNRTSVKNASKYMVSKGIKVSTDTVDSYIKHIEDAKLIYRARRMDSKTKEYLQTSDKFYATDIGMRNVSVGYTDRDLDGILENLVFMELMFRFGNASVMSVDGKEIDFVSFDGKGEPRYFQVSLDILDSETMKREITPLKDIPDNYPKYIITMDRYPYDNVDGIKIVNIMDFLVN